MRAQRVPGRVPRLLPHRSDVQGHPAGIRDGQECQGACDLFTALGIVKENDSLQVPLEVFGLMQQVYHRALYSLGPDVGCYAPPKLYENELKESLQVRENNILFMHFYIFLFPKANGFENWSYTVENVDGALHVRHKGIELEKK